MTYDEIDRIAATRRASIDANNRGGVTEMKRKDTDRRKNERRALAGRYRGGNRQARDDRRVFIRRLLDTLQRH